MGLWLLLVMKKNKRKYAVRLWAGQITMCDFAICFPRHPHKPKSLAGVNKHRVFFLSSCVTTHNTRRLLRSDRILKLVLPWRTKHRRLKSIKPHSFVCAVASTLYDQFCPLHSVNKDCIERTETAEENKRSRQHIDFWGGEFAVEARAYFLRTTISLDGWFWCLDNVCVSFTT